MNMKKRTEPIAITAEQSKLLESALRIKILRVLEDEPRTSKQVSNLLQKTPGNVHYHIQKLLDGGLLLLVGTQTVGGVVEKYYRSVGSLFQPDVFPDYPFREGIPKIRYATRLSLSAEELVEFRDAVDALLSHWESKQTGGEEYGLTIALGLIDEGN